MLRTFGHFGHYSGELNRLHQIAFDPKGNLYTAEAAGKRVQKFALVGGAEAVSKLHCRPRACPWGPELRS